MTGFEEVGRAVREIIEEPVHETPNSPADKERLVDGKTMAVADRDRRQVLEAAGLLGISAFATSLFGTFGRMLGLDGDASNDVRTHVNTVTWHVGIIGKQLTLLEKSVASAQENSFHTARRAVFERRCRFWNP